jgi:single-strand DNA-binding protein
MASFNKFMAVGYLSKDAEVKALPSGSEVAEFSIYTKEYQGRDKDLKTEFFDCNTFLPSIVELAKRGIAKGTQVYVEGKLESNTYENKQGVKITKWRVKVGDLKFLQPKSTGDDSGEGNDSRPVARQQTSSPRRNAAPAPPPPPPQDAVDDDCPF